MTIKKHLLTGFLILVLCLAACKGADEEEALVQQRQEAAPKQEVAAGQKKTEITWIKNYHEGLELAKKEGRPAMVFFTASWCRYCRVLIKDVYSADTVIQSSEKLVNIWVNFDKEKDLVKQYRVRGIPQVFFLDPEGNVVLKYNYARTPETFTQVMDMIAKKYEKGA